MTGKALASFPLMAKPRKDAPWWLSGAEEVCSLCDHPYAHGAGFRCSTCDEAVCIVCFETDQGETFCVECHTHSKKPRRFGRWLRGRSGKV